MFHLVYKFCREHYYEVSPVWDGVRQELFTFRGLMIVLESEWLIPSHPVVYATDSSEGGWAFTGARCHESDIRAACHLQERSRFVKLFGRQARASALISAGLGDDRPDKSGSEHWAFVQDFVEIPPRLLLPQLWTPDR